MKLYRIANWDLLFETHETRKLLFLKWVPVPNKHDGLSFRRIASQPNRCELFAAWNLILQVASKGRKITERGVLQRDGRPITPDDLAMMTGFPAKIFETALVFFSGPEIGWLEVANQQPPGKPADNPGSTAEPPEVPGSSPAEGRKGREGKEQGSREAAPDFSGIIPEGLKTPEFEAAWSEWIVDRKKRKKPVTELAAKKQLSMLAQFGPAGAVESVNASIQNGWAGLFDPNSGLNSTKRVKGGRLTHDTNGNPYPNTSYQRPSQDPHPSVHPI